MQTLPLLTWLLSKDKPVFNKSDLSFAKSGVTASKGCVLSESSLPILQSSTVWDPQVLEIFYFSAKWTN